MNDARTPRRPDRWYGPRPVPRSTTCGTLPCAARGGVRSKLREHAC